ncbi:Monoglyceride lipase [Spathaspora sp. JA1]|nr:Monoglyceride lipase [Spathaspora sp. JA1]
MSEKDSVSVIGNSKIDLTKETTDCRPVHEIIYHDNIAFHTYTIKHPHHVAHRGKFIIVHGWAENSVMYISQLEFLSRLGYDYHIYDQRGSGRTSPGKYRGRTGKNSEVAIKDLDFMIKHFTNLAGEVNLIGHSLGGSIALRYMETGKYRERINSIIVTSPLIHVSNMKNPSWLVMKFVSFLIMLFPRLKHIESQDPEVIAKVTSNPKWQRYLLQEESCQPIGTVKQMIQMIERGKKLLITSRQVQSDSKLLVLQSDDDIIVDSQASYEYYQRVNLTNKRFVAIPNSGHAIFLENDEILNKVTKIIQEFLN